MALKKKANKKAAKPAKKAAKPAAKKAKPAKKAAKKAVAKKPAKKVVAKKPAKKAVAKKPAKKVVAKKPAKKVVAKKSVKPVKAAPAPKAKKVPVEKPVKVKVEKVVVKNDGSSMKHGAWKFFYPPTGKLLATENYFLNNIQEPGANDPTTGLTKVNTADSTKAKIPEKPKPKEVLDFEKKTSGKKKAVRSGSTGG